MEKGLSKLRQIQLSELEILDKFVRICEKYRLNYYLVGGTLLGAVRHQGFIPWDDDIDVAMPREDYEKFADLCARELPSDYFYQCPSTDPYYFLTYAKIRKNGTEVNEERFRNAKFHKGIFIDIFPLDLCPKPGPICHFLFNILAIMNYRGQVDSGEIYSPYHELIGKIGFSILKLFGKNQLIYMRHLLISISSRLCKGEYIASYSGAYGYKKEVFPTYWYQKNRTAHFESLICSIPQETDLVLKQEYGEDFMWPRKLESKKHFSSEEH